MYSNDRDLLSELLFDKSPEFRNKVLSIVNRFGIDSSDPLFLILISTGRLEVLLQETPDSLERIFHNWTLEMQRSHQLVERELIERQKSAIAQAASELIRKAEAKKGNSMKESMLSIGSFLLGVFLFGFLIGYFFHR